MNTVAGILGQLGCGLTLEYVHINHVRAVGPVSDLVLEGVFSLWV